MNTLFKPIVVGLLLFMLLNVSYSYSRGSNDAILLKDVQTLTLSSGQMAKGSRSSPIPQLECIGGSAQYQYHLQPKSVQCHNVGSNGEDVQWECKANLDSAVVFGRLDVSCEGYAYPEDPYVLKGSCGLRYELEFTDAAMREKHAPGIHGFTKFVIFFTWVFVIGVVGFILYNVFFSRNDPSYRTQQQQQPYQPDGSMPYGPSYYPGSASWGQPTAPSAPPAGSVPSNYGSSWLPFLGGLGTGYAFGRPRSMFGGGWGSPSYHTHHHTSPSSTSRVSSGSGSSRSSSGFSGTSRR